MENALRPVSTEPTCPPSVFSDGGWRPGSAVSRTGGVLTVSAGRLAKGRKRIFLTYVSLPFDVGPSSSKTA